MPVDTTPYYCHEQIPIPPGFPDILKQFTKAAIRTQPTDVLSWSFEYFDAMAKCEVPPVKERLEIPISTQKTDTGLTPGLLRILNNQLSHLESPDLILIEEKWRALSLPMERFHELCHLGNFVNNCQWYQFLALAASNLSSTLTETLTLICELLSIDPEGGGARIPYETWLKFYKYLASFASISDDHIKHVEAYLCFDIQNQHGMVLPRNFTHQNCPKLNPTQ